MKKILLVCIFIVLFSCKENERVYTPENERVYTPEESRIIDSFVRGVIKKPEIKINKEVVRGWKYDTIKNKMTDAKDIFCVVQSNESLNLTAPYDGVNFGKLTVRRMNGKVAVIISIAKGQISGGYENDYIKARFDKGKQITFSYLEPTDNSTETIFVENQSKFLKLLRKSKKVLILIPLYQNGNQILEFNTQGLNFN
jgi:hypothetical protein